MKHLVVILLVLSAVGSINAQEYNLGLHFNPCFTVPLTDNKSVHDPEIRMGLLTLGYNAGANLNIKLKKKFGLETGVNVWSKTARFTQRVQIVPTMAETHFTVRAHNTAIEVPVLLGYRLSHSKKEDASDIYVQAGAAYELNIVGKTTQSYGASGSASTTVYEPVKTFPVQGALNHNVNFVAGLKVNSIVRGLGLIDYGISYHFPLMRSGPYNISSTTATIFPSQRYTYSGTFSPRLSYLDIKLCYYFLNVDSKSKRIKYKTPARRHVAPVRPVQAKDADTQ